MSVDLNFNDFIGDRKSLLDWLATCKARRGLGYWLLFRDADGTTDPSGDTEMFPVTGDTGDLTDDEFEWFDSPIQDNGYSNLLNLDQLEDVIDNLGMQKPDYTDADLIHAVLFYFSRDAFVVVPGA